MSETHKKPAPASTSTSTSMSATQSMPVVRLLQWSQRKGLYFLSAVLAIIGVAGTIVPYFAAANMIVGILSGVRDWGFFVGWGLFAAGGYCCILYVTTRRQQCLMLRHLPPSRAFGCFLLTNSRVFLWAMYLIRRLAP